MVVPGKLDVARARNVATEPAAPGSRDERVVASVQRGLGEGPLPLARLVGAVVRTKRNVKPVYVSPGHRIGIPAAVRWTLACGGGYRLPEPTRQAHLACNRARVAG